MRGRAILMYVGVGILGIVGLFGVGCAKTENIGEQMMTQKTRTEQVQNVMLVQSPPGVELDAQLLERLRGDVQKPPRTRHLYEDGSAKYVNRLALESSPYLRQHAHNPVNWFPWGEEAFAEARRLDRAVFLSIGYSTCHWCHVMEEESFEDEEIARYLNTHFIAVKVDREERPDVDEIYMTAVQMMTGRGGWPMTVVLMPDEKKQPFFSATYIPPRAGARGARQGLAELLVVLEGMYRTDRARAVGYAKELSEEIARVTVPAAAGDLPPAGIVGEFVKGALGGFDTQYGWVGRAPKFPQPSIYGLLLRAHARQPSAESLAAVLFTLQAMAQGGIHDQVGGGFHRYATDEKWLIPHFEKMLYDNAQLAVLYGEAFQVIGKSELAAVVRKTLDYVVREMTAEGGGFFSATDADSEGEEGLFFVWTPAQLKEALSAEELSVVVAHYGVTDGGNFEGRNILAVAQPLAQVAAQLGMLQRDAERFLQNAHTKLYDVRKNRVPPGLDDKVLTSWNGLMIDAFARSAWVLNEPAYTQRAEAAATFARTNLWHNGRLLRTWRNGQGRGLGFLDDYAFLICGLLSLFEQTADAQWLTWAVELQTILDAHFWDTTHGGYFATSDEHEVLLTRTKPDYDGAEPSGNALAAQNLLKLAHLTSDHTYNERAQKLLMAFSDNLKRAPIAHPRLLSALACALDRQREIFVILPDTEQADAEHKMLSVLRAHFLPCDVRLVVRQAQVEALSAVVPSLAFKMAIQNQPTVYICEHGRCEQPITNAEALGERL